jgi:hypothetical protein
MRAIAGLRDPFRWMLEDVIYWPVSRAVPTPQLDPETLTEFRERCRDDADRLRKLTGLTFEGWSV